MTTNKPQVKIVNAETGVEIVRDANEVELAQMQKMHKKPFYWKRLLKIEKQPKQQRKPN